MPIDEIQSPPHLEFVSFLKIKLMIFDSINNISSSPKLSSTLYL